MEIEPVPHRPTRAERRWLVLGLLVLLPGVLLVLLPAGVGLDRYVITHAGMDGSLGRGSVVLAREVPTTDLEVGDVITYQRSGGGEDARVSRRIVAIDDGVATVRGDAPGKAGAGRVPLTGSTYARVWLGVPWLGYPFVMRGGWLFLVLPAAVALLLALVAGPRPGAEIHGPGPGKDRSRTDHRGTRVSGSERLPRTRPV